MDPDTNRKIYDSDDEGWAKNRKKKLHDLLNLRKEPNKDVPESSKPKPLKYKIKKIPTHAIRLGVHFNNNFLEDFQKSIGEHVIQLFRATIFGPFLDIPKCNFQGQITKCFMLLELE